MGIDVLDIGGGEPRYLEGFKHGSGLAAASRLRLHHVVVVVADSCSGEGAVDTCSTGASMFECLDHHDH